MIVALIGIAVVYLWPTKKIVGWVALGLAFVLLVAWGVLEFGPVPFEEHARIVITKMEPKTGPPAPGMAPIWVMNVHYRNAGKIPTEAVAWKVSVRPIVGEETEDAIRAHQDELLEAKNWNVLMANSGGRQLYPDDPKD